MHAQPIVLPVNARRLQILSLIFIFVLTVSCIESFGQTTLATFVDEPRTPLETGKAVDREITGGQRHVYAIQLNKDQAVKVDVKQAGIDLTIELIGLNGKPLADIRTGPIIFRSRAAANCNRGFQSM